MSDFSVKTEIADKRAVNLATAICTMAMEDAMEFHKDMPDAIAYMLASMQVAMAMMVVRGSRPEHTEKVLEVTKMSIDTAARDLMKSGYGRD